jgi:ribonucleoside-triphosphate reductase
METLSEDSRGAGPNETHTRFAQIRKRDGRLVPFDVHKIESAILRAGRAAGEFDEAIARQLTVRVLSLMQLAVPENVPAVEQIQDVVEEVLLSSLFKKTAKAYILYRDQHRRIREIMQKASVSLVDDYLDRQDWEVQENSNMDYSLQGLNNYISGKVSKEYWLNKIYPAEVREAHSSGALHVHDLSLLSVYCAGWDLPDLLLCGFQGVRGKIESRPARHFRAILGQVVNFFYTLQGEAAGAQGFSNFDTLLAPFIRYESLSYDGVKQALQEFLFNMNIPTRVGFQTPFTNVTLDLRPPKALAHEAVVLGGQAQPETYGEFQREVDLFNQAFLEVMAQGDARGRPFTFPIPTYNITADFNWENPALKPLWEVTAKYGIPYFANFVNSDLSPEETRSMCCRLRLDLRSLAKRGGGLFGANPLTGSIGVVTINMPRLGHLATNEADFIARLDRLLEIARTSLETKRKVLEELTDRNLYPYTRFYLRHVQRRHGHYWENHFSTVGLVGMNEACLNLFGRDLGDAQAIAFATRVLDHMRERLLQFQQETGNLYNLEATPAEGTAYRLAKMDKQHYPNIICANEPAVTQGVPPFYTNSTHLPVDYTDDVFQALDLQDPLQSRYTGGTVLHVFLGEAVPDPQAVKAFIRTVCRKYHLPYLTISPVFSVCRAHGYLTGEHPTCPTCGGETEVYARVVGYLRPVKQWNEGKRAEFKLRRSYQINGRL